MENNQINEMTNWIQTLTIGDKLDAFHSDGHWKIATIKSISNDEAFIKHIKIRYDGIGMYETKSVTTNQIIPNTMLPLNTNTAFHQYLKPYNQHIKICQYLKPSLSAYDDSDSDDSDIGNIKQCHLCNKLICLCALISSPLQQNSSICRDCMCCYEQKQIIDSIQNANVNLDINSIKLISEFAIGFIIECCNELDSCTSKIYFDNTFDFLRRDTVFDAYGSAIYYYYPSKYNELKAIYNVIPFDGKFNVRGSKVRIYCSFCTCKLQNCEGITFCKVLDIRLRSKIIYLWHKKKLCFNGSDRLSCVECEQCFCDESTCGKDDKCIACLQTQIISM